MTTTTPRRKRLYGSRICSLISSTSFISCYTRLDSLSLFLSLLSTRARGVFTEILIAPLYPVEFQCRNEADISPPVSRDKINNRKRELFTRRPRVGSPFTAAPADCAARFMRGESSSSAMKIRFVTAKASVTGASERASERVARRAIFQPSSRSSDNVKQPGDLIVARRVRTRRICAIAKAA